VTSQVPEPRLIDAAHIVMDGDEQLGQPVMSNGLPLTRRDQGSYGVRQNLSYGIGVMVPNNPSVSPLGPAVK
jgi:hypothetical protein